MDESEHFMSRVREVRKALGLSQQAMSERWREEGATSIDRNVLANIESGRRRVLTLAEACAFSRAVGVSLDRLMTDEPISANLQVGR